MGIHADVIELPYANIFLLDSGKKGILGEAQLNWLEQQLGKHTDKPALVFAHFNPCQIGASVQSGDCGMEKCS